MTDAPLLPERAGCPQCGSTSGKRWRSYSGIELCTDCEWDFLAELNGRKLLDAKSAIGPKILPTASGTARTDRHKSARTDPAGRTSQRLGGGGLDAVGRVLGHLAKPVPEEYNSVCRLCGNIFYGAALLTCSRCGGLCELRSDRDLWLMSRHPHAYIESER